MKRWLRNDGLDNGGHRSDGPIPATRGKVQVVISGEPSALIFKERLYGELKANICGDCGHVELRVANPKKLYRHYWKSVE